MGFKQPVMQKRNKSARGTKLTPEQDGIYRDMMTPLIRSKTPDDVETAAKKIETYAAKHPWFKRKVHSASNMIVSGGKLSNYGIKEAQQYLKNWSKNLTPKMNEANPPKLPIMNQTAGEKKETKPMTKQ